LVFLFSGIPTRQLCLPPQDPHKFFLPPDHLFLIAENLPHPGQRHRQKYRSDAAEHEDQDTDQ